MALVVDPTTGPVSHPAGTILHVEPWRMFQGRPLDWDEILRGITRRHANQAVGERLRQLAEEGLEPVIEVVTARGGANHEPEDLGLHVATVINEFLHHPVLTDRRTSPFLRFSREWVDVVAHTSPLTLPADLTVVALRPPGLAAKKVDDVEAAIANFGPQDVMGDRVWEHGWRESTADTPTVALLVADEHTAPGFFPPGMVLRVFLAVGPTTVLGLDDERVRVMARDFTGKIVPGLSSRHGRGFVMLQGTTGGGWRSLESS